MRSKSPEMMDKIISYVEDYYQVHYSTPSTTDIANAVGMSRGNAYKYLVEMDEKGLISYDGKSIVTEAMSKVSRNKFEAAIVGSIACGQPAFAEENIEEYVTLPESIFGKGECYILRARGESMIEAGIEEGDLVVARKQNTADNGDIVVALVDGEATLKRFYKEGNSIRLHPENSTMEDFYVDDCYIQGVAINVIKKLKDN